MSWFQDAQFQRLADRLRTIDHVQLAQNLLHVVLHRQWADSEDGPDLKVALAKIDPPQNFLLADGYLARALGFHSVIALGSPTCLGAYPRCMQKRYYQAREVSVSRSDRSLQAGKGKETGHLPRGIVRPVRQELRGPDVLEFLREVPRGIRSGGVVAYHRTESTFFPNLNGTTYHLGRA